MLACYTNCVRARLSEIHTCFWKPLESQKKDHGVRKPLGFTNFEPQVCSTWQPRIAPGLLAPWAHWHGGLVSWWWQPPHKRPVIEKRFGVSLALKASSSWVTINFLKWGRLLSPAFFSEFDAYPNWELVLSRVCQVGSSWKNFSTSESESDSIARCQWMKIEGFLLLRFNRFNPFSSTIAIFVLEIRFREVNMPYMPYMPDGSALCRRPIMAPQMGVPLTWAHSSTE